MKRLLLLLALLPSAVFAQLTINVSFTYTSGAAALAAAAGTTVPTRVTTIFDNVINPAYTASSIQAQYQPYFDVRGAMGDRAPVDGAPLANVYAWAKYNVQPWDVRKAFDASISVHVTSSSESGYAGSPNAGTGGANDSVIVIPYSQLDSQLELALSKVLGMTNGFRYRTRSLPTDSLQGADYCYHTRESAPSDPNQLVPIPAYWQTNLTNYAQLTKAATPQISCEAARQALLNASLCGATQCASYRLSNMTATAGKCWMVNSSGVDQGSTDMSYAASPGSSPISGCTEWTINRYSADAPNPQFPAYRIGWAGVPNSVEAMNARVVTVSGFKFDNTRLLGQKRSTLGWIACAVLSQCN